MKSEIRRNNQIMLTSVVIEMLEFCVWRPIVAAFKLSMVDDGVNFDFEPGVLENTKRNGPFNLELIMFWKV